MNLGEYDIVPEEKDTTTRVQYDDFDSVYENKYPAGSAVSMKGRPDAVGRIDRIEDPNLIVKIFGETYSIPPQRFESLFYLHTDRSPENWYSRIRSQNESIIT
jgi:hypothetical protein